MRAQGEVGFGGCAPARRKSNRLSHWRKLCQDGSHSAVKVGEEVVPASELADALEKIHELERMLGKIP